MSNNYNEISREIVKSWYTRAITPRSESYDYFDKFISLWVSFNCYFVSEHYVELNEKHKKEPSERQHIDFIAVNPGYNTIYSELLTESKFSTHIDEMLSLLKTVTQYKGKVADMRPDKMENEDCAKEFTDKTSFSQFINVVYQVRCNLFHGNKSPYDDGDIRIVEAFFEGFAEFCKAIYQKGGYLP